MLKTVSDGEEACGVYASVRTRRGIQYEIFSQIAKSSTARRYREEEMLDNPNPR